ncbi:MAG: TldD/PmbA family protein [Candidatus Micrarchaeota archaeon]
MLDSLKMFHSFGLCDGEIFYVKENTNIYNYSSGSLKVKNNGTDQGFGIRVLKDKRIGFSYSNSKTKLGNAIKCALASSKFSIQSEFAFAQKQNYANIKAYHSKIANFEEKDFKEIIDKIAHGIKEYSKPIRIILVSGRTETAIANTNTLFAHEKRTNIMVYADAKNSDGFGCASYSHYKMLENPYEFGKHAGYMAMKMKNPKKIKSGKYSVIFSQETLASLFELLEHSFSGECVRRKISKLWDKKNTELFSPCLNIYDDPLADGEEKSAFDGEGVRSKKTPLIESGVVKNFYYDRETAALAKLKKEGNCIHKDYRSAPSLGGSNTVVSPGNSDSDPENELKEYVYIESMHGLHTANTTTGDFGAEVNIAFHIKKNEKKAVRGFIISENIFNLFSKVEYMGKEQIQTGNFISPQIAFKDVLLIS